MNNQFVIHSDYGQIGPIRWINSNTMPHMSWYMLCHVRTWGGFHIGKFEPGMMMSFSGVVVESDLLNNYE